MELRRLRYFVAIAEERSFSRAAERLWVAQPGLSSQIRRLETELGVKLFDRHTRGVDLTQAGELLLPRARAVLAAAETAGATARDLQDGVTGRVRLGIAAEASSRLVPALLARFAREQPGVELTLLQGLGGTLWRELRDGRIDALVAPGGHASPDLQRLELRAEEWVVLIGAGHPLAGIGAVAAERLRGARIAVVGHRDAAVFDRAVAGLLADLGVAADLVPGPPGPALAGALAGGELLALTTAPGVLPGGVAARPLEPRRVLSFELVWGEGVPDPALARFVNLAAAHRPSGRLAVAA